MYLISVLLLIVAHLFRSCWYVKGQNSVSAVLNFWKAMMRPAPFSRKSSFYRVWCIRSSSLPIYPVPLSVALVSRV
jgi:hypothetical protein